MRQGRLEFIVVSRADALNHGGGAVRNINICQQHQQPDSQASCAMYSIVISQQ